MTGEVLHADPADRVELGRTGHGDLVDPPLDLRRAQDLAVEHHPTGRRRLEASPGDLEALAAVFERAPFGRRGPSMVLARTIKGKGVSFMEGDFMWHSKVPNDEQFAAAMEELGETDGGAA